MTSASGEPKPEPKRPGRPEEPLVIREEDAEEALDRFLGRKTPVEPKAKPEGQERPKGPDGPSEQ